MGPSALQCPPTRPLGVRNTPVRMSVEQAVFAFAGSIGVVGAVIAAAHRDPRASGAALAVTLLALAVLYAGLATPVLAAAALVLAVFVTLPLIVHLTVAAPRPHVEGRPLVAAAGLLIGAAFLATLLWAVAMGEVPVNVSVRTSDGYDVGALREHITGRGLVASGASAVALAAAAIAARAVRRDRRATR